jgi:hypothetical protein
MSSPIIAYYTTSYCIISMNRQAGRQTGRQAGRQAGRLAGRQSQGVPALHALVTIIRIIHSAISTLSNSTTSPFILLIIFSISITEWIHRVTLLVSKGVGSVIVTVAVA